MTSSLKSRFDFANRRVLFVTGGRAVIYHWERSKLSSSYIFALTDEGLASFEQYLDTNQEDPVYILTDLADEEFKYDTIPHVGGNDRKSLVSRKKGRLFRNIKYSYHEIQGREKEGRRDDRVLFAGITDDEAIQPWVNRLLERKVPVAGLYSVALLSRHLLDVLGHDGGPGLIVSLQRNAGLRQTFFLNKDFKFSRLVRMPRYGTEAYAPIIIEEVDKMLRYLRSMRYLTNETLTKIYLIGDSTLLKELNEVSSTQPGIEFKFNPLEDVAARIGLSSDFVDPFSESIYAYLLLKHRPRNIYAEGKETRYYQLRRIRNAMLGSSIFILLASLIWGGMSFMEAVTLKQQSISAVSKSDFYRTRYSLARDRLPELPVEPQDLKTIVNIADSLESYRATPLPLLKTLSNALQTFPEFQLQSIDWIAALNPETSIKPGNSTRGDNGQNFTDPGTSPEYMYYQVAEIKAYIAPFDGNFRRAISRINQLIEALRNEQGVYETKILAMPLDVSSAAKLTGAANVVPTEAEFSFRLVKGITDED